jgi:DNA-binding NtrC family response regulator
MVQQHILIVAQDPFARNTREALLNRAGYEVTSVDSDDLAVISVDRDRFDLILIDSTSLLATTALDQRLRDRYPALCVLKIVPVGEPDSLFASRTTGPEPSHLLAAVRELLFKEAPRRTSLK